MILGIGEVYFNDTKIGVSETRPVALLAPLDHADLTLDWNTSAHVELTSNDLEREPLSEAQYDPLNPAALKAKSYSAWSKSFADALYRLETLELFKSPSLGILSNPGEVERGFRIRLEQAAKEARDEQLDRLRAKYAPKLLALEDKIRRAEQTVQRQKDQARSASLTSLVRFGTTILGAVVGRKKITTATINKAGTAIRTAGQSMKEAGDASRAKETLESLHQSYADLEAQFEAETHSIASKIDPLTESLKTVTLRPKKTNVSVKLTALGWAPFWNQAAGTSTSAWD
jgi:hypothetical protein